VVARRNSQKPIKEGRMEMFSLYTQLGVSRPWFDPKSSISGSAEGGQKLPAFSVFGP